jgi:ribonuclease J
MRDLEKAGALQGARPFCSMWEGDLKKESGARMLRWAEKHGIPFMKTHTSGHAGPADLRRFAEALAPKVVVPIRSFHPGSYGEFFPRIEAHEDSVCWELLPAPEGFTTTTLTSEGPFVPARSPSAEEPDP